MTLQQLINIEYTAAVVFSVCDSDGQVL